MPRQIRIVLVSFLVAALAACSVSAPRETPLQDATSAVKPTVTPGSRSGRTPVVEPKERGIKEERVETPTSTSEPSLRTPGPYFAYFRQGNEGYQFVAMDADGEGRRVVELPQEFIDSLPYREHSLDIDFISPDGRWLAFYSGSAGPYQEMPAKGTSDLTLNLLDLVTGERQVITPLLSKNYPENFDQAAKKLNDPYITAGSLYWTFINGITRSIAWSPDGRSLAFAAQMDGLSSDLYVYDLKTKIIRRFSSGDEELQWIDWSPDGRWIMHGSVFSVGEGMSFDIFAAAADGSSVRYLSTASLYGGIEKWLNPHTYFEYDNQNGPGDFGLRFVDIETGGTTRIWDGSFFSYNSDRSGRWIAVNTMTADILPYSYLLALTPDLSLDEYVDSTDNFQAGPYLINAATLKKTRIEFPSEDVFPDYDITPFPMDEQLFAIGGDSSAEPFLLSADGETTPLDLASSRILVSPHSKYWIAVGERELKLFTAENALVKSVLVPGSGLELRYMELTWSPDESGLFLVYHSEIYSLSVPDGDLRLVETKLFENYDVSYKWISNQ